MLAEPLPSRLKAGRGVDTWPGSSHDDALDVNPGVEQAQLLQLLNLLRQARR